MRIAIVLDNIYGAEIKSPIKKVMLFEADEKLVIAIDEDTISLFEINYLSLWLLTKQVVRLYCDGLSEEDEALIKKAGIEIYPLKYIRDHPILQALLLKE